MRSVLVIEVPRATLEERLKGRALKEGRPDDADAKVISKRLDTYSAQTEACIGYFRKTGDPVHVIDGVGSIEEVEGRILRALDIPAA